QLENPKSDDVAHLLTLARLNWDKSLAPGVETLLARAETPAPTAARALLLLRVKAAKVPPDLLASAGKRLLGAVDRGDFPLNTPERAHLYLEFLENEGATPAGLTQLG